MLSTPAVWGQFIADFTINWFFYVANTFMPQYLGTQLGFNLSKSGLVTALPNLFSMGVTMCAGAACDWLIQSRTLRTASARVFFNALGGLGAAACLLGLVLSPAGVSPSLIVVLFVASHPRDSDPKNCPWGPRNIYCYKSLWTRIPFDGPWARFPFSNCGTRILWKISLGPM
jgi:hypothetical protein